MKALALALLLGAGSSWSGPQVAIIIDDLGNRGALDRRAVALPGPVAMSVLPHSPHAGHIARRAHAAGKEVLVHLPMQQMGELEAGPREVGLKTTRSGVELLLDRALASVPHARGVNNHQGSLITRHPGHMQWLMDAMLRHEGLYFVDSRTTPHTVAERMARESGVPTLARDVFLDDDRSPRLVEAQFDRLLELARRNGRALAIGHPHAVTLDVLERRLPELRDAGIELVTLSRLLQSESMPWRVSSSP